MSQVSKWIWGTGRRKTAVARVRLADGSGQIMINDKPIEVYFTEHEHRASVFAPIEATNLLGKLDIFINATGGGISGQAGAAVMGIARALLDYNRDLEPILRENKFLTRDSRMKERKKYGRAAARKRYQFSKR